MLLNLQDEDAQLMLAAKVHVGSKNVNYQMSQYVFGRNKSGEHIFKLDKIWEKLVLAARAICAVENSADITVIASRNKSQRAVLKFARYTKTSPIAGRFTPGTFTNQIQAAFKEPRLLVVNDPIGDHQPIREASFVNIPVIAFCNSDSAIRYVDVVIPCNNQGDHAIGLMWWLLAREVLRMRGEIGRDYKWDVMVDLFFFRDPEKEQQEEQQNAQALELLNMNTTMAMQLQPEVNNFENTEEWGDSNTTHLVGSINLAPGSGAPLAVTQQSGMSYGAVGQQIPAQLAQNPEDMNDWGASDDKNWN